MNILIYGEKRQEFSELIRSCGAMQYRQIRFSLPDTYDDYLARAQSTVPELIVICQSGAVGMEAVIAAKEMHPKVPVVWFSDDKAFGAQSYRLGCAYFTAKPVNKTTAEEAIIRCFR